MFEVDKQISRPYITFRTCIFQINSYLLHVTNSSRGQE